MLGAIPSLSTDPESSVSPRAILEITEALQDILDAEGVHGALRFLNQRSPHRFTGIYRLDPPLLRNVFLFDRENPGLQAGSDAPLRETYCSITGTAASPFHTDDAQEDSRLQAHPARDSTLSYCGVPLWDPSSGAAVGTLCHFDLVPRPVPVEEIRVLEAAAPLIMDRLRESGAFPIK